MTTTSVALPMISRLPRAAYRAGMIYLVLMCLMHPLILGPLGPALHAGMAMTTRPVSDLFELGAFPLQGELLFRLIVSTLGGVVWARISPSFDNATFGRLLLLAGRFVLAAALIAFGVGHLFGVLAPVPSQADWIRPIRELEAPHFLAIWIGSSKLHIISLGMSELTAGIMVLFPRTTLFGAFLGVGVLGNEALSQFSFGDPRTGRYWFPFELAGIASLLILTDFRRFFTGIFLEDRPVPPLPPPAPWPSERLSRAVGWARHAAVVVVLLVNLPTILIGVDRWNKAPIAGVYRVETFQLNGRDSLSAEEAATAWTLVAIDDCSRFAARVVDGRQFEGAIEVPGAAAWNHDRRCAKYHGGTEGLLTLVAPDSLPPVTALPALAGTVSYSRTDDGLAIDAALGRSRITATLRRIPDSAFGGFRVLGSEWD